MKKTLGVGLVVLLLSTAVGGTLLNALSEPSHTVLDADLSKLREKITATRDEASRYDGGLLRSLIDARIQILANSEAMLEQKRTALIRFVNLDYTIDGKPIPPLTEEAMRDLTADMEAAKAEISSAKEESALYAGGLLKVMAETRVTTGQLKLSMLELRYLSAKWGVPVYGLEGSSSTGGKTDMQNIVPDDGAL
jgi:hypothetical protein